MIDLVSLSKTVSHALRHEPWLYELELNTDGWVSVAQLLASLRIERECWKELSESDLLAMILTSSKRRHEMREGRIRAIYGHSIPESLKRLPSCPPETLFHGTSPASVESIKQNGLLPMGRQNVHLSVDEATASEVGRRKSKAAVLLRVNARLAFDSGIAFYEGNGRVWLADVVPSQFIEL